VTLSLSALEIKREYVFVSHA